MRPNRDLKNGVSLWRDFSRAISALLLKKSPTCHSERSEDRSSPRGFCAENLLFVVVDEVCRGKSL